MDNATFIAQFESFPKEIQKKLIRLAEELTKRLKDRRSESGSFKFNWEGKLKSKASSVELQHKANTWR